MATLEGSKEPAAFGDLGLDPRLLRALEKREYVKPTPVQVRPCISIVDVPDLAAQWKSSTVPDRWPDWRLCSQAACIPAALEGKDIIARAHTGSGKTLAYLLPALNKILALPKDKQRAGWQALIYVPTRELCEQVCHPQVANGVMNQGVHHAATVSMQSRMMKLVIASPDLGPVDCHL